MLGQVVKKCKAMKIDLVLRDAQIVETVYRMCQKVVNERTEQEEYRPRGCNASSFPVHEAVARPRLTDSGYVYDGDRTSSKRRENGAAPTRRVAEP